MIGHFFVQLLKQKIIIFGLITIEKKFAIIVKFKFLITLRQLKTYLGFTSWLQKYVKHYAKNKTVATAKTTLLKKPQLSERPKKFMQTKRNSSILSMKNENFTTNCNKF